MLKAWEIKKGDKMLLGQTIRSELPANREESPGFKKRQRRNAFGIYRPVDPADKTLIIRALKEASHRITEELGPSKYTELLIPKDLGVTFVKRQDVAKALKTSGMRNFNLRRLQNGIGNYNYRATENAAIGIREYDWYGPHSLKFVGKLAMSDAREELGDDTESIRDIMAKAGAERVQVYEPDHLTLCRFRSSRHGRGLSADQKDTVEGIVVEEFRAYKIGSITLGEVMPGHGSYSVPLPQAA